VTGKFEHHAEYGFGPSLRMELNPPACLIPFNRRYAGEGAKNRRRKTFRIK